MTTANKAAARSPETKAAQDDFLAAFEAFKAANDQRLEQLERKGAADTLLEDKVARIDAALTEQKSALDRMTLNARRPSLGGDEPRERSARGRAFDAYARAGDASAMLQVKALSAGSPEDGGHVVPDETEAAIDRRLAEVSPIRAIATVRQVSAATFKKPVSLGGATAGWTTETASPDQTDTPTLDLLEFPTFELYAMPAATQQLLDDAAVNIDEWLAEEVRDVFAAQESAAFVAGDTSGRPKGFVAYDSAPEGTQDADELGYLATGTLGGFDPDDPLDALIELIYAPKPAYRPNGRFVMNRRTLSQVRRFKDADGNYVWQPATSAGQMSTLLGYPVTEAEDMPDVDDDTFAIAFGDFRRGYLVVDRQGVRVLREAERAGPLAAVFADPWPGDTGLWAGADAESAGRRAVATRPAIMGELVWGLWPGPVGRWDDGNVFRVRLYSGALESLDRLAALAGGNLLAVESANGWEVVSAREATLVEPGVYELRGLLRGLAGTEGAMASPAPVGARVIVLNGALVPVPMQDHERGVPMLFGAGARGAGPGDPAFAAVDGVWSDLARRPLAPVHLRGNRNGDGVRISWTRRTRIGGDGWAGEAPLGEDAEAYEVEILDGGGAVALTLSSAMPETLLTPAYEAAIFGGPVWSFGVRAYQLSPDWGRGAPATQTLYLTP